MQQLLTYGQATEPAEEDEDEYQDVEHGRILALGITVCDLKTQEDFAEGSQRGLLNQDGRLPMVGNERCFPFPR